MAPGTWRGPGTEYTLGSASAATYCSQSGTAAATHGSAGASLTPRSVGQGQ